MNNDDSRCTLIPKLWVGQLSLIGISEVRLLVPEVRFAWR